MRKKDAIAAFGGVKSLADALGIWPQAVYGWPDTVPELRQWQIEKVLRDRSIAPNQDTDQKQ